MKIKMAGGRHLQDENAKSIKNKALNLDLQADILRRKN